MGLVKRTYVDGETVITAENLNDIQDAIIQNEEDIATKGTYSKPSGGIPSTDLASAVQTSLGKADTALQSSDIDSTLTVTGKAADAKKTGDEISDVRNTLNHKADVIYDTASGDIASFPDGADGLPVKDLTVAIDPVQSGSGDPSPTNVRPISGWTKCNVSRTGKNLIPTGTDTSKGYVDNYYLKNDGSTQSNENFYISEFFEIKEGATYTWSAGANANAPSIAFYDSGKNYISSIQASNALPKTFVVPNNVFYCRASQDKRSGQLHQIEVGSSASSIVPYNPASNLVEINFPSDTMVYGGTLDVTTGVMTVTDVQVDLGDLAWTKTTGYTYPLFYSSVDNMLLGNQENFTLLCSEYIPYGVIGITNFGNNLHEKEIAIRNGNIQILVQDSSYNNATATEMKAGVSGIKLVYKLATPQTYQLDPVTVTTLLGQNNVWSDTGTVLNCEYPADTKLYIQKINTPTDDDMIADANIASGKYFIVNNNLYLSTAAILAGDPIKPGTNCTLTNLAAALNALNS